MAEYSAAEVECSLRFEFERLALQHALMSERPDDVFRAAIFDMDGLLLDSEPFWQEAERAAFATVGVELADEDLCQTIGMRVDEVARYWFERRPWDREIQSEEAIVEAVVTRVVDLIKERGRPLPGVVATLDLLRGEGLALALASSSPMRIIEPALSTLGLRDYFSVVYSAEVEARGKPDPAVYLSTMDLLGVVPEACFALEDSIAGLQSAQSAGMKCVVVPEPRQRTRPELQAADLLIESLQHFDLATLRALAAS